MIPIPDSILESATREGINASDVSEWFLSALRAAGMEDRSPAEWPDELWQVYRTLREPREPDAFKVDARHLFESLNFFEDDSGGGEPPDGSPPFPR